MYTLFLVSEFMDALSIHTFFFRELVFGCSESFSRVFTRSFFRERVLKILGKFLLVFQRVSFWVVSCRTPLLPKGIPYLQPQDTLTDSGCRYHANHGKRAYPAITDSRQFTLYARICVRRSKQGNKENQEKFP